MADLYLDADTNSVSLALHRYLCQNIVGTENQIKTTRLLNAVRDVTTGTYKYRVSITSGSFGEGLEMRGSDLDMMYVAKFREVYAVKKIRPAPNITYYRMESDDVKAGFTQLLLETNENDYSFCEELNGKHFLSSTLFKQPFSCSRTSFKFFHGPCITDRNGIVDHCFCLHCKIWISQASQWITRSCNSWPSYKVKQSIIKHGVLFVPIGVRGSPKEDLEWRISFSVGEKMLISTFTHTQLLCYALLKILLKDVIATYSECSDLLCSYFMKTIIFWISEDLPESVWKPENLIPCFLRCFSRLVYCVKYSACLHYFIPENNMFENKIEGRAREILLDRLNTLHGYDWRCILFSDQLSNFHASMWIYVIEPYAIHTFEVEKTLNSELLILANHTIGNKSKGTTYVNTRLIQQIVYCKHFSHKYFYTYYTSVWCSQSAQSIPLNISCSNKHQYKQYDYCLGFLLQNIYHDAVSGWLMLASFFYKSEEYSKALHIIMYSLSKCTPEKLYRYMDISDIHYKLLKLKSFSKKSIVRLWKIILLDLMTFEKNSWLIPNELQMEGENSICFIPSIVYAFFLKFLCHYHLDNVRQCQDCLHNLQLVIAEQYFIEKKTKFQFQAYNILGIALHLSGDNEAASQAFKQSVEKFPCHRYNTSTKRLSLMR